MYRTFNKDRTFHDTMITVALIPLPVLLYVVVKYNYTDFQVVSSLTLGVKLSRLNIDTQMVTMEKHFSSNNQCCLTFLTYDFSNFLFVL